MRIIAGTAKRTPLRVPSEHTRPTTDRVREALFSRLQPRLEGARVADLFAGSGALGLEALSRGAASCDFVELRPASVKCVEANLRRGKLGGGRVVKADVFRFLGSVGQPYDLVFADPPWPADESEEDFGAALLEDEAMRTRVLAGGGLLILEQRATWTPAQELLERSWEVADLRFYGKTALWSLCPRD